MRICVLTPTFLPRSGGVEVAIDCLAREWRRSGHEVHVLAQRPRGEQGADVDYPVRHYPRPWSQKGWYGRARRMLARWHRKVGFDIVHAQMAYPAGWIAWRSRRDLALPVAVTCQGGDVSRTSRFRDRPWIRRRLARTLAGADLVTAVSAELARAAGEFHPGARIEVIPNGVDPALAVPVNAPSGTDWVERLAGRPFLLDMKRLHPSKGHAELVSAWAALAGRRPDVPSLVIAGEGRQRADLERLIAERGVGGGVLLTGQVDGDARRWLLQNCLAFVHPSWREGMPLVINEAMACGRPVLAARSEGVSEQVQDGVTGWMVAPADQGALEEGLERVLDAHDLAQVGERARLSVAERHWTCIAERYLERFRRLAGVAG